MEYAWLEDVSRVLKKHQFGNSQESLEAQVDAIVSHVLATHGASTWSETLDEIDKTSGRNVSPEALYKRKQRRIDDLVRAPCLLPTKTLYGSAMYKAEVQVRNHLTLAKLLRLDGRNTSALATLRRASSMCKKYHLTIPHLLVQREVMEIAAFIDDGPLFAKATALAKRLDQRTTVENEAKRLEAECRMTIHLYASSPAKYEKLLHARVARLQELQKLEPTFTTALSRYRSELHTYAMLGDAERMMKVCSAGTTWLNRHPNAESRSHRLEFEGSRMSAAFMLKDYQKATKAWASLEPLLEKGSPNWEGLLQLYFLVCTSSGKLEVARDVVTTYNENQSLRAPEWRQQMWLLYSTFIQMLVNEEVIKPGAFEKGKKIYLASIRKTSSHLVRDKPQLNVLLVILDFMLALSAMRYSDIVAKAESLRIYASRYMRERQTQRTGLFLRCLTSVQSGNFDSEVVTGLVDDVKRRYEKAHTLDRDDAEVIPYDTLWELVMKILERNQVSGKRRR